LIQLHQPQQPQQLLVLQVHPHPQLTLLHPVLQAQLQSQQALPQQVEILQVHLVVALAQQAVAPTQQEALHLALQVQVQLMHKIIKAWMPIMTLSERLWQPIQVLPHWLKPWAHMV
jgi:hypothetical protein